ncbi:MAG TPA: hypothetical protein VJA87_00175 [Candidatus Paceibacterota bacterium]
MFAISPNAFRVYDELVEYGVGYVDALDFLYVGKAFIGNRDLAEMHIGGACPSLAVELQRPFDSTEPVGVKFNGTVGLVKVFWNKQIPDPCKVSFASELADLCLTDPNSYLLTRNPHGLEEARVLHARARHFTEELDLMPESILSRMRELLERKRPQTTN